jgi:hypothetical protein
MRFFPKYLCIAPAVLFLAGLLFAYGCDCAISGGTPNGKVCILGPDDVPFSVDLDGNGSGSFTPADGTSCSDYKICEAELL